MSLEIVRADTVRQAVALLAASEAARLVGGGTLVVRDVNSGDNGIDTLVLSDGLGFDRISVGGGRVELGAAVTMADVLSDLRLDFIHVVARSIGGPAVRAMATVGGNLFAPYPYGDFTVALLALGAEVILQDGERVETLDLEAFLAERDAGRRRIVRGVTFDALAATAFRFTKAVRRHPHGGSVVSIAAALPLDGNRLRGVHVAYGAMAPLSMRARAVEGVLEGRQLDREAIDAAVAVATEGTAPLTDAFASDWYRSSVLPVHLARLLAA